MRLRKDPKATSSIVTSDAVLRHGGRKSLIAIIAVVVILLVVGGIEVAAIIRHRTTRVTSHATPPESASYLSTHPGVQVQNAQAELQNAHTPHEKSVAYQDLGTAYLNNKQGDQAIAAYQQALQADSADQQQVLAQLASAYIQLDQPQQAISTLQKIITILQQTKDPSAPTLIPKYQQLIQELQQGVIK